MDPSSVKRRLTCILAADAVGYSKQMGHDEEGTIRVLSAHRAVIDGIITFHGGRIVSTAGDSVLAEFTSVVEAVRCAVEIQEALKTRNDSLEEHRQMHFRVGVNLGDVVVKNDDLLGDGVNVAARLETMAEPGGICISSSVYDQITGKLDLGFQDIGEQTLKNISRPIRVYRVSGSRAPARATAPTAQPAPRASRSLPWAAIGVVAAAAVGAAVAWQGGWLRFGSSEPAKATATAVAPVPAPTAQTSPAPAAPTSATPAVDGARAQAEADARRLGAEAEATKRQAAAERARLRAQAEADAARIRADAEASAARTKSDAEAAAKASTVAQAAKAREAVTVAAAPAVADKGSRIAPGDAYRFDGRWNVLIDCPRHTDGTAAFRIELAAQVKDGFLKGERGAEGSPNWFRLQGVIEPDGNAKLDAKGLTGDPKFTVGGARAGSAYTWSTTARFEGSRGTGRRTQLRTCDLTFVKQ